MSTEALEEQLLKRVNKRSVSLRGSQEAEHSGNRIHSRSLFSNNQSNSGKKNYDFAIPWYETNKKRNKIDRSGGSSFREEKAKPLMSEEIIESLQGVIKNADLSSATVNISQGDAYVSVKVENNHLSRKVRKMESKQQAIKYYVSLGCISTLLLGVFFTSGIAGLLSPLPSIVGSLVSVAGGVGLIIDWKEWEKIDV